MKEMFLNILVEMLNLRMKSLKTVENNEAAAELAALENLLTDSCDTLAVYHPDRADYFWRIAPYRDLIEKVMTAYSHDFLNMLDHC